MRRMKYALLNTLLSIDNRVFRQVSQSLEQLGVTLGLAQAPNGDITLPNLGFELLSI